jgi:transcription elongation factor Elf1
MGRKKSKRKPQKTISRLRTLQTLFECPFCNHESSCDVKFDRKKQRAQIFCRICLETFETDVNCKYETQNKYLIMSQLKDRHQCHGYK